MGISGAVISFSLHLPLKVRCVMEVVRPDQNMMLGHFEMIFLYIVLGETCKCTVSYGRATASRVLERRSIVRRSGLLLIKADTSSQVATVWDAVVLPSNVKKNKQSTNNQYPSLTFNP